MAEKKFQINYGKGVTVFPARATDKILCGEATLAEIKTLSAILTSDGVTTPEEIAAKADLSPQDVENAVAFWRGAGILTFKSADGKQKASEELKKEETEASVKVIEKDNVTENPSPSVENRKTTVVTDEKPDSGKPIATKKALLSAEMPKYSGEEISALLNKDGGRLKNMVDECQQLIGHIFNPHETETMVGICDWLGVDSDFLITLTAYYTRKKPGCNVNYILKAATALVNSGIDSIEPLDAHLKELELYDGLAGKLRSWLGIGARAYTQSENAKIKHWIRNLGYGEDIVKFAYDITVENTLSFNFKYANTILENWYKEGIKTLEDAEKHEEKFKNEKKAEKEKIAEKSSFDTDEFFNLAVKRSYEKMASGKNKKEN